MSNPETADLLAKLREACGEIVQREREELSDMGDPNCYGAGWSSGAINAAEELMACIDEEINNAAE